MSAALAFSSLRKTGLRMELTERQAVAKLKLLEVRASLDCCARMLYRHSLIAMRIALTLVGNLSTLSACLSQKCFLWESEGFQKPDIVQP